jgi:hypothetical protein
VAGSGIEGKVPANIQISRQINAALDPFGNILSELMNRNAPNSIAAELVLANSGAYDIENIK